MSLQVPRKARQAPLVEERRMERELFFWTWSKTLKLVLATALVVYAIIALFHGNAPDIADAARLLRAR